MLKKDNFQFKHILSSGYEITEDTPTILNKKTMADGSIKVVYAQYTSTSIVVTFGNMTGTELKDYNNKLVDGSYQYWSIKERAYKTANFVVEKTPTKMFNANNGETWEGLTVTLTKSSEV